MLVVTIIARYPPIGKSGTADGCNQLVIVRPHSIRCSNPLHVVQLCAVASRAVTVRRAAGCGVEARLAVFCGVEHFQQRRNHFAC